MACLVLDIFLLALQTFGSLICGGKSLYLIYSISTCQQGNNMHLLRPANRHRHRHALSFSVPSRRWPLPSAEVTCRRSSRPGRCTSLIISARWSVLSTSDDVENFSACVTPRGSSAPHHRVSFLCFRRSRRSSTPTAWLGFVLLFFVLTLSITWLTSSDQSKSVAVLSRKKSLCL